MNALLLDTHAWLWYVNGDKTLKPKSRVLLNEAASQGMLFLSAISTWEIAMLEAKHRIQLSMPTLQWIQSAIKNLPIQVIHLTPEIVVESCQLLDMYGDPADRLIVSTARVENLTLLTRDQNIQNYAKAKHLHAIPI
jgi:PIN domain nuclease of toxin-antitoxin system